MRLNAFLMVECLYKHINLVPEFIPFEFSLIHHLEKERERAWNNQKQETKKLFMAMAEGMI